MKLHIGSGDRRLPDWINCDKDYELHQTGFADVKLDASDLTTFGDNSIEEIYASHVLDHLSRKEELDKALSEWYRVLRPGGILRVAVSNFEMVAKMYNEGLDLERLWGHIVGGHKSAYDKHGCVFDFALLKKYLDESVSIGEAQKKFSEKTGLCRKTFYNLKQKV